MCGIFSLLAARKEPAPSLEGFMETLESLTSSGGPRDGFDSEWLEHLEAESLELMAGPGVCRLARDERARRGLARCARRLGSWAEALEGRIEQAGRIDSVDLERLNEQGVRARDLAWRIERDILAGVAATLDLVAGSELTSDAVLASAWRINASLNAIDRLEVRGRDSAGLAVVVRLEDAADLDRALATSDPPVAGLARGGILGDLLDGSRVVRPDEPVGRTVVFTYKVAEEVGKIGDNGRMLRHAVHEDGLLWHLLGRRGATCQILAHTRWASNGVISVPNCHPIDGARFNANGKPHGAGRLLAVLNGDIDNYLELRERYLTSGSIDPRVTTDAKIIPLVVEHHLSRCGDLGEAFRLTMAELQGSMAIALVAANRPDELLLAQKGSGQGLFVGDCPAGIAVASELYGLVELGPVYVKLNGERRAADGTLAGEVIRVCAGESGFAIERLDESGVHRIASQRFARAEISTRDIDRGEHEHFLAKEIRGAPVSVRKTLRGRLDATAERPVFRLGRDVVPESVIEGLRDHTIRRIDVIGQGTAAVAGAGIARLVGTASSGLGVSVRAIQAAELSGHHLRREMSDLLVIAVSQSGTTTDTNRAVDLVRERGARVVSIVNRRNSDLVFRSDGVLYTSDGRDIEMSVASTKAFYAQIVAGQLLALYLAGELGTLSEEQMRRRAAGLRALPGVLERILATEEDVARCARRHAGRRKHWAVVGSGMGRVAADEIRIKLSELCYKSIAVDFTEDKKHIDLSSEPLVLVCATGLPEANVADSVKEVAILKAHHSLPIVITEEGEDRFDGYAEEVLRVPVFRDPLAFLSSVMAGHLFGYHAARAFDCQAASLRDIRRRLVRALQEVTEDSTDAECLARLVAPVASQLMELGDRLIRGDFDSSLEVATAVRLAQLCDLLVGRLPLAELRRRFARPATVGHLIEAAIEGLSGGITELARPIDAIKHQAKTVTVGTSRAELRPVDGVLWEPLRGAAVLGDGGGGAAVPETVVAFLNSLQPLVSELQGGTHYRVAGLDPLGRPTSETTIEVVRKWGVAAGMRSRAEQPARLSGTKWRAVKERSLYLGVGDADRRHILIFPVLEGDHPGELFLYHIALRNKGNRSARLAALRALPERYDRLVASVTERDVRWEPALIDAIDNETLFFAQVEQTAAALAGADV